LLHRLIGLTVVTVALSVVLLRITRPASLTILDAGIVGDTAGNPSISWSDIAAAIYIDDLPNSEYLPTRRLGGTAFGDQRTGWFRLANGDRALVALQRRDSAVLITTHDTTYLFGPTDIQGFAQALAMHVVVRGQ
jgi:hypothetical protein